MNRDGHYNAIVSVNTLTETGIITQPPRLLPNNRLSYSALRLDLEARAHKNGSGSGSGSRSVARVSVAVRKHKCAAR
jgi:hypothetical protein